MNLSAPEVLLLAIIACAALLIISGRFRSDLVALLVLLALWICRVVEPTIIFSGFSSATVVTLATLPIVTGAFERAGLTQIMANWIGSLAGQGESRLRGLFAGGGAILSLFMNNIAAAAILLPAGVTAARRAKIAPSKILIPLAYGTLLGGMSTYFTSANIIISNAFQDHGKPAPHMADFLASGGLVCVAGLIFLSFFGNKYLPDRSPNIPGLKPIRTSPEKIDEFFQLRERLWELQVQAGSRLRGQTIGESDIGGRLGVTIVAVWRGKTANLNPSSDTSILEGDILLIAGREDRVRQLSAEGLSVGPRSEQQADLSSLGVVLVEALVAPHSAVRGRTLKELNFRRRFGLTAVALWREGQSYRTDVSNFQLQFGDALLMVGTPEGVSELEKEADFIVLEAEQHQHPYSKYRWRVATFGLLVFGLSMTGVMPASLAMLLGAVLMILTGALSIDDAYRLIDWRPLVMIAGMLPLGLAITSTGLAKHMSEVVLQLLGHSGPLTVLCFLYFVTVLLGQILSGPVTAVILSPVSISLAGSMGIPYQAAAITLAVGCSTCFLSPTAHPVNILVMGPAGYTFGDFFRIGWKITLLSFGALVCGLMLFWGL